MSDDLSPTPNPQHTTPSPSGTVRWDENGQPISPQFDDVYFSKLSGIDETHYVFLEGNELPTRWLEKTSQHASHFAIGETGFGTGLNFLCAWKLWKSTALSKNSNLHFYSVEKFPLNRDELRRALNLWPTLSDLAQELIEQYPPQPARGFHRLILDQGNVTLTIFFGEASEGFSQWQAISNPGNLVKSQFHSLSGIPAKIDAWFLDGFAPAKNPEMWTEALFNSLANLSGPNTTFATFTAAGIVRRGLSAAGFDCRKIKGFAHKREMLIGQFSESAVQSELTSSEEFSSDGSPSNPDGSRTKTDNTLREDAAKHKLELKYGIAPGKETSWHLTSFQHQQPAHTICVIGAGIAGCQTAFALAKRHKKVILIEKNQSIAAEASGNLQGAVYGKLSPHSDALSIFNLNAQIFANQFYQHHNFFNSCGDQCGVLHLANGHKEYKHYIKLADQYSLQKDFAEWISAEHTKDLTGLSLSSGGLFIAKAGWLNPRSLCEALTRSDNVSVHTNTEAKELVFENNKWKILSGSHEIAEVDAVVISSAHHALKFPQTAQLPLKQIRGQVTYLPAQHVERPINTVICGDGYIAPSTQASEDQHCHTLGATFTLKDFLPRITAEENLDNLAKLKSMAPELNEQIERLQPENLNARVGFRCTTPDYLPIVGPVPDRDPFIERFSLLRRNANTVVDSTGHYYPALYCNVGHGSRGLCYTPLCAELLASMICGELLPISRDMLRFLHPGRFIVRDLARRKI